MPKINDLWDGSMDQPKVRVLDQCRGNDGYRAQEPQHSLDSWYLTNNVKIAKKHRNVKNGKLKYIQNGKTL